LYFKKGEKMKAVKEKARDEKIRKIAADFEKGWEDFPRGTRVEVRTKGNIWRKGTVVDGYEAQSERGINILCDEKWHNSLNFYGGRGASIPVYLNTRPNITANIRLLNEAPRQICDPATATPKLNGNAAEFLRIAKIAAKYSDGRLRLAYNEEANCTAFNENAGRFLKLDGRRLEQDLECYWMYADSNNWPTALAIFYKEVIVPIKKNLPKSYAAVWEKLLRLAEKIYPEKFWPKWRELLKS